ncbi:Gfo/Idh/MocA family protein [Enterococcus sp. DIV0876]|uniref:Gfo/Idh/MocA family protein n=1 Tax=Enterococcus sp. DIV0876 TaxID=2774633 RepID=UPI003D2FFC2F
MINWGIIGAGNIATRFAESLTHVEDAQLYGVACRTMEKANAFREKFPCEKAFDQYQALLDDPAIDVVYIALPHLYHFEWIIKSFTAKKAVLCEKPATMTAEQMRTVKDKAIETHVFFMEAMKPRFTPAYRRLKEIVSQGEIGEIKQISTTFRRYLPKEHASYHYLPEQGGALLDMGIYNLAFIQDFAPKDLSAEILDHTLLDNGVDTYVYGRFYNKHFEAFIETGFDITKDTKAEIIGSTGKIVIPNFHRPKKLILTKDGKEHVYEIGYDVDDFHSEIAAVIHSLNKGEIEHPLMSFDDSIASIALSDQLKTLLNH